MKKIPLYLSIFLAVLLFLFALMFGIVYTQKDEIGQNVVKTLNEQQSGKLTVEAFDLTVFKSFPYISLDLKNVAFRGPKSSDALSDSLGVIYAFEDIYVGFDIKDLIRGEFTAKNLFVENGHFHWIMFEDGTINVLEAKLGSMEEEKLESEESDFKLHLDLQNIELKNVTIKESNFKGNTFLSLHFEEAKSRFSFIDEKIVAHLDAETVLEYYQADEVVYFKDKPLGIHTDFEYNLKSDFLQFLPGKIELLYGHLNFEGSLDLANDWMMDFKMDGKSNNFDVFISMAPDAVFEALDVFRNEGDVYFNGTFKGPILVESPSVDIEFGCENTFLLHKGRDEKAVDDIEFRGLFTTGADNSLATSSVLIENFQAKPQNSLFKGRFYLENFEDPRLSVDFHGSIDLAVLPDFYPIDGLRGISGIMEVDITVDEFMEADSIVEVATQLEDGTLSRIVFKNVALNWNELPYPIEAINGMIQLDGDRLLMEDLNGKVADSDFHINLMVSKIAAYLHGEEAPMDVVFSGHSALLDFASLLPKDSSGTPLFDDVMRDLSFDFDLKTNTTALNNFIYLPSADFYFRDLRFRLDKYPHELKKFYGKIHLDDEVVDLENLQMVLGRNDLDMHFKIDGIEAIFDTQSFEKVPIELNLHSDYFNLKELLVYDEKPLISDAIEEEVLQDFHFKGSGHFVSNSFSHKGFLSEVNIDDFRLKFNDLPPLRDTRGKITTDTAGCIHIIDFYGKSGSSDLAFNLDLEHFLDSNLVNKKIKGNFKSQNLDLDELLGYMPESEEEQPHDSAFNYFELPFPNAAIALDIQKMTYHRYALSKLHGKLRITEDHFVYVDTFNMNAAGGFFGMKGYFNGSNPDSIYYYGNLVMDKMDIDQIFYKFDNFGQDYILSENIHGILSADVETKVRLYPDLVMDLSKSEIHADVLVENGRLQHFAPMKAMSSFLGNKDLDDIYFGELRNRLDVVNGKLLIPNMHLTSSIGYIYLSGTQGMDLDMDYQMKIPLSLVKEASWNMLKGTFKPGRKNKAEISDEDLEAEGLIEEEDELKERPKIIEGQKGILRKYININVSGNPDDFDIKVGKKKPVN